MVKSWIAIRGRRETVVNELLKRDNVDVIEIARTRYQIVVGCEDWMSLASKYATSADGCIRP